LIGLFNPGRANVSQKYLPFLSFSLYRFRYFSSCSSYQFSIQEKTNGEIKIQKNSREGWTVFFKQRLNEKGKKTRSLILEKGNSSVGTKEIVQLFDNRIFATPKPEILLEHLIYIATKKGDLVLDYHLGSGTTCAVAHKMGRQYIGIEPFWLYLSNSK
jgi:adenine specific DNA methylase Mod